MNTFNDLSSAIAQYLHRNDLLPMIPTFIQLAEARFNRELRTAEQEKTAYHVVTDGDVILPADFLELRVMYIDGKRADYQSPDQLARLVDNDIRMTPPAYTIQDRSFKIFPQGTVSVPVETRILYFSYVPALGLIDQSNWLLTKHPDAYLYHSLVAARGFVVDDQRMASWQMMANEAMAGIRRSSDAMLYGPNMTIRAA